MVSALLLEVILMEPYIKLSQAEHHCHLVAFQVSSEGHGRYYISCFAKLDFSKLKDILVSSSMCG